MTLESNTRPTFQQIREVSQKHYFEAHFSVAKAQSEHTQLLQKLSNNRPNDVKAKEKAQNAIDYHQRITKELNSIKTEDFVKENNQSARKLMSTKSQSNGIPSTVKTTLRLPIELNYEIVEQIISSDPSPENQKTLKSLCETSSEFRAIAEPYLWKDIGDLDTLEKQWRFRYAVAIHPELGFRVKRAHVFWQSGGANGELLKEICLACPNLEDLLIQRGGNPGETANLNDFDLFEESDGIQLFELLRSLKKLRIFTWASYVPPPNILTSSNEAGQTENGEDTLASQIDASHAKNSFPSLTSLDLRGWTSSFSNAILNNLTEKVDSIRLGSETNVDHKVLSLITSKCTKLRELEVRYMGGVNAIDLMNFAKHSNSLENLQITQVNQDGQESWFANVLTQHWKNLRSVSFGVNWTVFRSTLHALSLAHSPALETLNIWDLDDEVIEDDMIKMLERQVSTLKECSLGGRNYFTAGKQTLKVLQNAKHLQLLSIPALTKDVEAKDVDILLQTCSELWNISPAVKEVSEHETEWKARELKHSHLSETKWANNRLGT